MTDKCWVIIPAAGVGSRMGGKTAKQYFKIGQKTVIEYSLDPFIERNAIVGIVVVIAKNDNTWQTLKPNTIKPIYHVYGGANRYQSVFCGLEYLSKYADSDDWVLVHDAARPCLTSEDLKHLIETAKSKQQGCILASRVSDTIKMSNENSQILQTVDRSQLWRALTPQMFQFASLRKTLAQYVEQGSPVTDEAEAMEKTGTIVNLVAGATDNIKITQTDDMIIARAILEKQGRL